MEDTFDIEYMDITSEEFEDEDVIEVDNEDLGYSNN